jgi:hypothetical protein
VRAGQREENMMTEPNEPTGRWQDYLPEDAPMTEESVWQAIADANGLDYSEIADGDLVEWL